MTPWCVVLVCSWRRLLADRHLLAFPWTLSPHLCIPLVGCANRAPGLALFHFSTSTCKKSDGYSPGRGKRPSFCGPVVTLFLYNVVELRIRSG